MLTKLLARQLRRALALRQPNELQETLEALQEPDACQSEPAKRLLENLPRLISDINDSYRQYERDLDLRSHSLEISSEELVAANERLRQEALEHQQVTRQLRATTNQLLHNNHMPPLQEDGHDLLSITHLIASLVSQREEVRRELQTHEARLRNLIANLPGCIYRLTHDGTWSAQILSGSVFELTGYDPGDFLSGKLSFNTLVEPEDLPRRNQAIQQACRAGMQFSQEYRIRCRDGSIRWVMDRGQGIYAEDGTLLSIDGVILDNTAQHEAQESQRRAREAAEAANEAKSRFLANVSHEMRTPLNGILGMTELTLASELDREQREHLSLVKTSADSLLAVINDLLDFARIEHGDFPLEQIRFSLRELLLQILPPLALRACDKGLQFNLRISGQVPEYLSGDPTRLRQVIVNLVGNAVKFTEHGKIDVEVDHVPSVGIHFRIRDTGIGIALERQAAIFQPFIQADVSTTRLYGGTGLGLSISAQLVEKMGGMLRVHSLPGHGSLFHFELPASENTVGKKLEKQWHPQTSSSNQVASMPIQPQQKDGGLHILLAEDNPVNQKVAVSLLALDGHRVTIAENGLEVENLLESEVFDLILMDIQMPHMDGLACTRRIRGKESGQSQHIPIIALTAHATEKDREDCLNAGMDGFASKPFKSQDLLEEIRHVISRTTRLPITDESPTDSVIYDRKTALEMLCGDAGLLVEICRVFLRETPATLAQMQQALEARDAATLIRTAHTIKSSLGAVGALRIMAVAQTLEDAAHNGTWPEIESLTQQLESRYQALCLILSAIAAE